MSDPISNFSELLSNPLGDLISSIGKGVGEAQAALDAGSLNATLDIYREDMEVPLPPEERRMVDLIREIGYQPTFYVIPETEVEAQISLSMSLNTSPASPLTPSTAPVARFSTIATPLNAGNVNRYHIQSNAVAKLKFKIVPVPAPAAVTEMRVVPDLVDETYDEALTTLLTQLGFTYRLAEGSPTTGVVDSHTPESQAIVRAGTEIVLTLRPPTTP